MNNDPSNACWTAFQTMQTSLDALPTPDNFGTLATVFLTIKTYINSAIIVASFYAVCNIDQINIEMGKRLTSVSGLADLAIGSAFTVMNEIGDPNWQNAVAELVTQANTSGEDSDWMAVGAPVGILLANFLHYEVPTYDTTYGNFTRITTIA